MQLTAMVTVFRQNAAVHDGLNSYRKLGDGEELRRVSTSLRPVVMEFSEHFHLR